MADYNYAVEAKNIAQKRKILQALQEQQAASNIMPTGGAQQALVPDDAMFNNIASTILSNLSEKQLDEREKELTNRYESDRATGMQAVMDAMLGGERATGPTSDPATAFQTEQVPGDMRKAIALSLQSQHPDVQALGSVGFKSLMDAQAKNQVGISDLFPYADRTAIPAMMAQGAGAFKPKPEYQDMGDFGIIDMNTRQPVPMSIPQPTIVEKNGDLYQQYPNGVLKKLDNAAKINVSNTVHGPSLGEDSLAKTLGEKIGESTMKVFDQVPTAKATMALADNLEALNAETPDGVLGPTVVWMGQFAKSLGMPIPATVSNGEQMQGIISREIAKYLTAGSGVGRSMTDEDRKAILSQWPTLSNTVEGRAKIITLLRGNASNILKQAEETSKAIESRYPGFSALLEAGQAPGLSQPVAEVTPIDNVVVAHGINPATGKRVKFNAAGQEVK